MTPSSERQARGRPVFLCYCDTVKNVTVSVPDEVYRQARIRAAEAGTSVSALVARYLGSLSGPDAEFRRLADLQDRVIAEIDVFRASDRLDREAVHERAVH